MPSTRNWTCNQCFTEKARCKAGLFFFWSSYLSEMHSLISLGSSYGPIVGGGLLRVGCVVEVAGTDAYSQTKRTLDW